MKLPKQTWQERLRLKFPLQSVHDYHDIKGHIANEGELESFIAQILEEEIGGGGKRNC